MSEKFYFSNSLVGVIIFFIGFVNTFWGNDPYFGLCILLASVIFWLPLINLLISQLPSKWLTIFKLILVLLIFWASLGVGELFDKIDLMNKNFPVPLYESPLEQ